MSHYLEQFDAKIDQNEILLITKQIKKQKQIFNTFADCCKSHLSKV